MLGAVVLALGGCATVIPSEPLLHGETMGSEWTVRIAGRLVSRCQRSSAA